MNEQNQGSTGLLHEGANLPMMLVESTRFGTFELEEDRALRFAEGLLGLPDSTSYALIEVEDSPYAWLQSVDEPELAFLTTSPWEFYPDYDLEIDDADQGSLGLDSPESAEVLILLTIHRQDDEAVDITANLLGPIVVNTNTRVARQIILSGSSYSTQEPLVG